MRATTILGFLFGLRSAVEGIAQSRSAIWVGAILVLLTAIARNYDQTFILETPLWLLGPLLFSLASGLLIFSVLYWGVFKLPKVESRPKFWSEWLKFMALFWMTAPIAWLYAIPVERFFDSLSAAKANLALLGVVSLWRVVLLSRAVSIVNRVPMLNALGWVATAALLEVLLVLIIGLFTSGHFEKAILAGMGGLRNSPEESLLVAALGNIFGTAIFAFPAVALIMVFAVKRTPAAGAPERTVRGAPWVALAAMTTFWIALAWPAQQEQIRFVEHKRLIEKSAYRAAIDHMARHGQPSFPPSRRVEPSPYERPVHDHLPPLIKELNENDPKWVRDLYLSYAAIYFSNLHLYVRTEKLRELLLGIEELPEGAAWFDANRRTLKMFQPRFAVQSGKPESVARKEEAEVEELMQRLGIGVEE